MNKIDLSHSTLSLQGSVQQASFEAPYKGSSLTFGVGGNLCNSAGLMTRCFSWYFSGSIKLNSADTDQPVNVDAVQSPPVDVPCGEPKIPEGRQLHVVMPIVCSWNTCTVASTGVQMVAPHHAATPVRSTGAFASGSDASG